MTSLTLNHVSNSVNDIKSVLELTKSINTTKPEQVSRVVNVTHVVINYSTIVQSKARDICRECGAHPQHHFVHGVQLGEVPLCVRVPVVQVDGSRSGVTRLSYHGSQGPGQLVDQIRPDDNILDQPARRPGSCYCCHLPARTGSQPRSGFVYLPVQPMSFIVKSY